jgi:8-oxo-dGTP pyrophosphatase MutT (NUDIX family)
MPRAPLLRLLQAHHPLDAHESAMLAATIRFVAIEPRCAERSLATGHLTGSAWIVDPSHTRTLLTHHRKLDLWLQLGGHADGDLDLAAVALREAREESGLASVRPLDSALFDVDRHWIPAHPAEPGHWHYDLRFLFVADPAEPLVVTPESKALAWVALAGLAAYTTEASMVRLARRTARLVTAC